MKENNKHTTASDISGKDQFPLRDFFLVLKRNDFTTSPEQIEQAYLIIRQFAGEVENESELCEYLSPIFAKSEDEQIQFKAIFNNFFTINSYVTDGVRTPLWKRSRVLAALAGVLVLVFYALYAFKCYTWIGCDKPTVELVSLVSSDNETGRNLELRFSSQDTTKSAFFDAEIDWGDGKVDMARHHSYTKDSVYKVVANIAFKKGWGVFYPDTIIRRSIKICIPAEIRLEKSFEQNSITIGDEFSLGASIIGKEPDSVRWFTSNLNTLVDATSKETRVVINEEGEHSFSFKSFYGAESDLCNIEKTITVFADKNIVTPTSSIAVASNARLVELRKELPSWAYAIGLVIFVVVFFITLFAFRFYGRKKDKENTKLENEERYKEMIHSFSLGKMGSLEIPFLKKDYLPIIEAGIEDVAKNMRMRVDDDINYLNINKTISKTISNVGLFEPVYTSRTQQCEFLVLVQQKKSNDQQTKLFDFLINQLKRQGVYIDKYYFNHTLLNCYNHNMEVTLEKLSAQYPKHVLLVYGDAHQMIHRDYPVINRDVLRILNNWEHKAVITPISYVDWGYNEKQLILKELPIFPVDVQGQLLLMKMLFGENVDLPSLLNLSRNNFYNHMMLDFEDVKELMDYCKSFELTHDKNEVSYENVFFQWVTALAVYPKIRWDLSLAIGKALFERNGLLQRFDFTALLRFARIAWIAEGKFPDFIRLELLTHLSSENELLARETILQVLNEIPKAELNEIHFAYEEKEIQRIINEFVLYAFDSEKYKDYETSRELFKALRNENVLTDSVGKSYLENENLKWETLINNRKEKNGAKKNKDTLEDYLNEKPKEKGIKIHFWTTFISSMILFSLLSAVLLGVNVIHPSAMNEVPTRQNVWINYESYTDSLTNKLELNIDDTTIDLLKNERAQVPISETHPNRIRIPLTIDKQTKSVKLRWNNTVLIDSAMVLEYDSYVVSLGAIEPIVLEKEEDPDGDGVFGLDDECPETPGLPEYNGCPDSDGDGIEDRKDACPNTFGLVEFNGCPESSPNPVRDLNDYKIGFYYYPEQEKEASELLAHLLDNGFTGTYERYPIDSGFYATVNRPRGNEIRFDPNDEQEAAGLLKTILDGLSTQKPFQLQNVATLTPGFISVFIPFSSESGDFDDDGVLDKDDNCPKQAGPPSNNGCPEIDTDEDGVPDAYDDCPNEPGPDTNRGCPEEDTGINLSRGDRDGDGVLDSEDDCPSVPGPASNKGCPYVDSDEDGVLDKDDQCPDVPGTVANNGCPGVTNEIINQLNEYSKSILFDTGKFTINEKSLPAIQYIAEIMKEYPTASFLIEGHVDQVAESSAQYLSLSRARAVNDYLVGLGIDQNRLSVEGFGDSRPIASNLTREGRQQNRRIEIKLLDQ